MITFGGNFYSLVIQLNANALVFDNDTRAVLLIFQVV